MKKLLIVVDYQNDFVDGALGFPGAELLDGPIAEKIAQYRASDDTVIFTFDTHNHSYLQTQEGRNLPVEHCLRGTQGHELYGRVGKAYKESDLSFYKPSFGSSELFLWLYEANKTAAEMATGAIPFKSIELVGLVSNICVISNAILAKAACPEVPVIVDSACCASNDPALHQAALDVMAGVQIQVI